MKKACVALLTAAWLWFAVDGNPLALTDGFAQSLSPASTMSDVKLPNPIDRFIAAVNGHDKTKFLAFLPEDGVVDDRSRRFVGRRAIQGWTDREFIGMEVQLKVTGVEQSGDQVSVVADVQSKGFNGPSRFAFVLADDRIREMRIRSTNPFLSFMRPSAR